jgi:alkylation response protein AidB-like acyl-CoA dehydrogenase
MNGKSILALAHREGGAWGRTHDINTSASASESCGFVLNGTKSFVLSGPAADQFLISARTSSDDRDSIALFLVNQTAPGLQQQPYRLIDGTRVCDLTLDEVAVCKDAIVATGSSVSSAIENAFEDAIVCSCAEALGAMEGALWLTVEYLKGRDQSGAPLSTYQALQHRMADMLVEVEISRSAVHLGLSALAHKDEQRRRKAISACKVQVSQSAKLVGETGVQLHGAMGLANEHRMGQYFKRLTVIAGLFGGVESHLDQFGSLNTAET